MPNLYLVNQKTGMKYKIISLDQNTGMMELQGPNAKFKEKFDKEALKRMGYKLVREEDDAV